MKHEWFRIALSGQPARAFALAISRERPDVIAIVQRRQSGRWGWSAAVDRRRPDECGEEPTMYMAMDAARDALVRPVRI
jgi:hypothetical protein